MVIGTVKWFGGSTKDGHKNNFGFLSYLNEETGKEEEIYVNRREIPRDLQELFETDSRGGEGIYVEFDISTNGKTKAINLKLYRILGTVIWFSQERGYIRCQERENDVYLSSEHPFCANDIIFFGIRYNSKFNNEQAIETEKCDPSEDNKEIIERCSNHSNYEIFYPFLIKYISILSNKEAIDYLVQKINFLSREKQEKILIEVIEKTDKNLLLSDRLEDILIEHPIVYAKFFDKNLILQDNIKQRVLWQKLLTFLDKITENNQQILLKNIKILKELENLAPESTNILWKNIPVKECANSFIFEIYYPFFIQYINTLPKDEASKFILSKMTLFSATQQDKIIEKIYCLAEELLLESSQLRQFLSKLKTHYTNFLNKHLLSTDSPLRKTLLSELVSDLEKRSDNERLYFWQNISYLEENLEYQGTFWNIAPIEYKKKLIQKRYAIFFEIVTQFNNSAYPYSGTIKQRWQELYQFGQLDIKLIQEWSRKVLTDINEKAKMLSARGAEKLAINFYQSLGYAVEDISSQQVTSTNQDWIKGDIRINSDKLLDVKNARKAVNSKVYSEFCIPQFKTDRTQDVKIVAVLSPYLQSKYLEGNESPGFSVESPLILGEFYYSQLKELESIFSDKIAQLDMSRGFDPKTYLPPWVFDYNDKYYSEQLKISERFSQLTNEQIPRYSDLQIVNNGKMASYIPLFIYSGKFLPSSWQSEILSWQSVFIKQLTGRSNKRLTLPYLYLSILKHFLQMLSEQSSNYQPNALKEILFASIDNPLKIYDPLGIISDFCDTLQTLWLNRQKVNLTQFKVFKFNGRGLLTGKCSENDLMVITILAYCGGWIEGKGKCGNTPLVIGKDDNCPECGKLICSKEGCGYCSNNCSAYKSRQNTQRNSYSKRRYYDSFFDHDIFDDIDF